MENIQEIEEEIKILKESLEYYRARIEETRFILLTATNYNRILDLQTDIESCKQFIQNLQKEVLKLQKIEAEFYNRETEEILENTPESRKKNKERWARIDALGEIAKELGIKPSEFTRMLSEANKLMFREYLDFLSENNLSHKMFRDKFINPEERLLLLKDIRKFQEKIKSELKPKIKMK